MLRLTLVAVFWITATSFAQAQATKGSQAAYDIIARSQQMANNAELRRSAELEKFKAAKKVSLTDNKPMAPRSGKSLDVRRLEIGDVGLIDNTPTDGFEIIDDMQMIVFCGSKTHTAIKLENCPTKGLVDNDEIRVTDYVKVVGISKSGPTMHRLRLLNEKEAEPYIKKHQEEAAKRLAQQAAEAEIRQQQADRGFRQWTGRNGDTIKAKFASFRSPTVKLELENGKFVTMRITALSDSDAELARKLGKQ